MCVSASKRKIDIRGDKVLIKWMFSVINNILLFMLQSLLSGTNELYFSLRIIYLRDNPSRQWVNQFRKVDKEIPETRLAPWSDGGRIVMN